METKASLNYARVGAQKARLVADMVRGKNVDEALKTLTYMNKKTAILIKKLIESAVANADYKKTMNMDKLFVKSITVDGGPVLKRFRPRAQGRAFGVRKKLSHINVTLGEK
ncbi:MAG: 50S ribosomal protein L22 [Bdellovibrionales bacterium RIFCSPHIGHO2_01_FULL_40_29]|nr:MAG: 50S ribosomal protein L22 [Bdellovibrionales bacterium RIFCSPHIGHO2_01_FULL_40_29]OFZ33915.1 MAG: 50S ribosomal protein L22 [Bdellovibrionales bacterium RIFCSPHIGHO2_02_FULL_40_15]